MEDCGCIYIEHASRTVRIFSLAVKIISSHNTSKSTSCVFIMIHWIINERKKERLSW